MKIGAIGSQMAFKGRVLMLKPAIDVQIAHCPSKTREALTESIEGLKTILEHCTPDYKTYAVDFKYDADFSDNHKVSHKGILTVKDESENCEEKIFSLGQVEHKKCKIPNKDTIWMEGFNEMAEKIVERDKFS